MDNLQIIGVGIDRVKTGIKGVDELIDGGIPKGFNVLVTGEPGTGKTIFGMQYLVNGAKKGEPGIYVDLDMPGSKAREQANAFGWDIEKLEKDNMLAIIKVPLDREKIRVFDMLQIEMDRIKAKRLVFDSLATFAINVEQFSIPLAFDDEINKILKAQKVNGEGIYYSGSSEKRITFLVINHLSQLGTTNLIITDQTSGVSQLTMDGVSEYVCDGLINLKALAIGDTVSRTMEVRKMRSTKTDGGIKTYEIARDGIVLR